MLDPSALAIIGGLAQTLGLSSTLALTAMLIFPVMAATVVLTWHGLRGTDPGPAATQLLALVEVALRRRLRK